MRSTQRIKWVHLWTVAMATAMSAISGVAQEATPDQTQPSNGRKKVVILVERPRPSVIRIKGFDTAKHANEVGQAQIRIADSLYDWISARLSNHFQIQDRSLFNQIFSEAELEMIFDNTNSAAQRLRLQGADLLVVVRPVEISFSERNLIVQREAVARVVFTARVVDARTSETVLQRDFSAEAKTSRFSFDDWFGRGLDALFGNESKVYEMITNAGNQAVQQFAAELAGPTTARVLIALQSDRFILSVGKRDGITQGMHLKLERLEEIALPGGGVHRRTHEIGVVKVVGVDEQTCEVAIVGNAQESLRAEQQLVYRPCDPPRQGRKK